MALPSGETKPPLAASCGKFVGMRVPGIISFGRRTQSGIHSWRRRSRARVRFGASEAVSATFGTGGASGFTGVVTWHCEQRIIVKTCCPTATFCGVGWMPRVVSNGSAFPSSAKYVTS